MNIYKPQIERDLRNNNVNFERIDEDAIRIYFNLQTIGPLPIVVFFGSRNSADDNDVHIAAFPMSRPFTDRKCAKSLEVCNQMNGKWSMVKFFLYDNENLQVELSALLGPNDCVQMFRDYLDLFVKSIVDAYPEFMRVMWA